MRGGVVCQGAHPPRKGSAVVTPGTQSLAIAPVDRPPTSSRRYQLVFLGDDVPQLLTETEAHVVLRAENRSETALAAKLADLLRGAPVAIRVGTIRRLDGASGEGARTAVGASR